MILAAIDDSPMAALVTQAAARLAAADGRAVYVVHAQEDVTATSRPDGEDLAARPGAGRGQLDLLAARRRARPRARSCGTPPVTARPAG